MLPYPLNHGGAQGMFHFINSLRKEYQISLLFKLPHDLIESYEELSEKWTDVTFFPYEIHFNKTSLTFRDKIIDIMYSASIGIRNLIAKKNNSLQTEIYSDFIKKNSTLFNSFLFEQDRNFINYVADIAKRDFDIIQIEFYEYLPLIHVLPNNVDTIFVHHELRYIKNKIEMDLFSATDAYENYLFQLCKEYELNTLKLYDKVVTVSEIDKLKIQKELPELNVFDSPLMIEQENSIENYTYKFNNKITFVASTAHFPNVDGIKWFILYIWPCVIDKCPSLELHLIGKGWSIEVLGLDEEPSNVFFDGYVENLGDVLPNSISIIPIRIGSGMRMKILDAVNFKIPFITTNIGVEGLDFKSNEDCIIVDNPIEFAESLVKLTEDESLQNKFIESASETKKCLYNKDFLLDKRRDVYK